jgi:three-Cys-motif partner protein
MCNRGQMVDEQVTKTLEYDEVGEWSELKLEILRKYCDAYSPILTKRNLHHSYIDGFAGAGHHLSRRTGDLIPGSPINALDIVPPFREYHFIDLDDARTDELRRLSQGKPNVYVYDGDCNDILLSNVFPKVLYKEYRRALCVLDPYHLQLKWEVLQAAAREKTIEVFLNFPIMDMNRNVFREGASAEKCRQMTTFWGDESWREVAFYPSPTLFGGFIPVKQPNEAIVEAFRKRLREVAEFKFVPKPVAMRNSVNSTIYYLFFAAHHEKANKIMSDIFNGYRKKGILHG